MYIVLHENFAHLHMYIYEQVTVVDNLFTGTRANVEHWIGHPHFTLLVHDVTEPILLEVRSSLGKNKTGLKDFCLKAKARIWPCLSCLCLVGT